TVGDGTRQGGELFCRRGQVAAAHAGLVIEGTHAVAAAAAVVIGTLEADNAEQAQGAALPLAVIGGGLAALRAGDTGTVVAIFFEPNVPQRPWQQREESGRAL